MGGPLPVRGPGAAGAVGEESRDRGLLLCPCGIRPSEQMALSGVWGTEALPGRPWSAGPTAAALLPDPGFRAGGAGAWAADTAWGPGAGRPAAALEWSGAPDHPLTRSVPAGTAAFPAPSGSPRLPPETSPPAETRGLWHTEQGLQWSARSLLGLFKNCRDSSAALAPCTRPISADLGR